MFAGGVLRFLAFSPGDADAPTPATLRFDAATLARLKPSQAVFDATSTDFSAFFARGGRLILWHGLADPEVSPATTLVWWRGQGDARIAEAARLFLVPGLAHCRGGAGATRLDTLDPAAALGRERRGAGADRGAGWPAGPRLRGSGSWRWA
jgi:tannase/feruloyl esterase